MFLKHFTRLAIVLSITVLIGIGIVDYLKNFDENDCTMTYMREYPQLIPINFDTSAHFPNYKLHLYCEGSQCHKYEHLKFTEHGLIPVLFITGNADSHMQVRSLASISLDKTKTKYPTSKFLYFTISFNEELSALYGPVIEKQTQYARRCIQKILSLFSKVEKKSRPRTVVVIGNSMGGIVARNLLVNNENFDTNTVHTIITKSSPHVRPVINIDQQMSNIYNKVNEFWMNSTSLSDKVLVSLYGGHRDILVRSGLSNIKNWTSSATIISSYTPSIPYVWRSIDHRCMAWCRELIMTVTRALFDLVDAETGQIYSSKSRRESILRQHFEGSKPGQSTDKVKIEGELTKIVKKEDLFYEFNGFNLKGKKTVLFDFDLVKRDFDSLFLYSNFEKSVLLCKNFEDSECSKPLDLIKSFGQILPPLYENRDQSLRSINLNNLQELVKTYRYLVINVPFTPKSGHQTFLKLDWYKKEDRFKNLRPETNKIDLTTYSTFTRFYLPYIKNIFQVYDFDKVPMEGSCDYLLRKEFQNNKNPLLSSCVMLQFNEPQASQTVNSESIQFKSKNISIKLSSNADDAPFVDVIKFELKHLSRVDKNSKDFYKILIRFNYIGALGQFIRFYATFFPAYLVAILQFYDLLTLWDKTRKTSRLVLDVYNTDLKYHVCLSLLLSILGLIVENFATDFRILKLENLNVMFLPIFLYWSAYVMLTILCIFVTILSSVVSILTKKLVPNSSTLKGLVKVFHFIMTCVLGVFSSVLSLCMLFYGEFLSTCLDESKKLFNQTKLFFVYILLVFNVPGLIVWVKSIGNSEIKPMSYFFEDCAQVTALGCLVIVILNTLKFDLGLMKIFNLNSQILCGFILINLGLTVIYSTVNVYRVQYFVLSHLFLVWLRSDHLDVEGNKKKQD